MISIETLMDLRDCAQEWEHFSSLKILIFDNQTLRADRLFLRNMRKVSLFTIEFTRKRHVEEEEEKIFMFKAENSLKGNIIFVETLISFMGTLYLDVWSERPSVRTH